MDKNRVDRIIHSVKKKIYIVSAVYGISAVALIMFLHGVWFALAEILLIAVIIILLFKVYNLDYLINNLCDPELYYYVFLGLMKKEPPPEKKQKVAEQIGDYSSAVKIAVSRLNLCKKDIQKLPVYLDILRIAFDAGDFKLANSTLENIDSLKVNPRIIQKYKDFFGFYSCYIDGDYYESKQYLDNIRLKLKIKNADNLIKYKLTYYKGLLSRALGDYDNGRKCFEIVANGCPKLNIAAISQKYLSDPEEEIDKTDLSYSIEKGKNTAIQKPKVEVWRFVTLILAVIGIIISGFSVRNSVNELANESKEDTIESAISIYHDDNEKYEILFQTAPDEKSVVTVCKDTSNRLSVEYLKHDEDYECRSSGIYERSELKHAITGKMSISGNSKSVHFVISRDKKEITDDYTCTEISYDDETLYFGYRFDNKKLHIFDTSSQGIQVYDSNGNRLF